MIVYCVISPSGKLYVGKSAQTLRRRWQNHCALATMGKPWALHHAIRKYGSEGFQKFILADDVSPNEAALWEIIFIALFRSRESHIGYNMTAGGDGVLGWKKSAEARERTARAHRGKLVSDETRRKIGASRAFVKISEETRQKIRKSMKSRIASGNHFTEDHKARISASLQKKLAAGWRPVYARNGGKPADGRPCEA